MEVMSYRRSFLLERLQIPAIGVKTMQVRNAVSNKHTSRTAIPCGFTLIELLVVISVIAVLMAILMPVMGRVRESGQRAVCLSNLRQLTLAWILYAEENDGRLVGGVGFEIANQGGKTLKRWMGTAFQFPENRSAIVENPDKGALWPFIQDIDAYRCPRGFPGHAATYAVVSGANGITVQGTTHRKRVGKTVLHLTHYAHIISPCAAQRAVFVDYGQTPQGDFHVPYLSAQWFFDSVPPIHHANGMTLSMADGHVEYWKWKGRETIKDLPRKMYQSVRGGQPFVELLEENFYEPQTAHGQYDLQRIQKAIWGRLGYSLEKGQ
jgi:prepilin-type N-terminal cleavage/methylation domain-containing protein/prepilin-type processing-associated H-X9-DG protein